MWFDKLKELVSTLISAVLKIAASMISRFANEYFLTFPTHFVLVARNNYERASFTRPVGPIQMEVCRITCTVNQTENGKMTSFIVRVRQQIYNLSPTLSFFSIDLFPEYMPPI
jgi:hypothetical protein